MLFAIITASSGDILPVKSPFTQRGRDIKGDLIVGLHAVHKCKFAGDRRTIQYMIMRLLCPPYLGTI